MTMSVGLVFVYFRWMVVRKNAGKQSWEREKADREPAGMFQQQQFEVLSIKHCRWFESIMISWQNDFDPKCQFALVKNNLRSFKGPSLEEALDSFLHSTTNYSTFQILLKNGSCSS